MKVLSCDEFRQFTDPYIDAEFEHSERALFDAHLSSCEKCRRHFEHRTWFQRGIRPALKRRVDTSVGFKAGIQNRLRAERRSIERRKQIRRIASAGSAIATVVVVLVFVSPLVGFSPTVVDEVLDHHQLDMPLELPTRKAGEVNHWMKDRLPFNLKTPTFEGRRVRLMGGRLSRVRWSDQRASRPAAHLIYQVADGRKMSVLVFESPEDGGKDEVIWHEREGHRVAIFVRGKVRYAITAQLPEVDFQRVVASPW